jgi:uncharacterized protein
MKLTGHTALVTGASAGIGKAFATELAARGANLVLTARRRDRLDELAEELRRQHGRQVTVIPADLSQREAPEQLMGEIASQGVIVDMLINNAGYGLPGLFAAHAWQEHAAFMQVLVTSVVHLTHLCLPAMIDRRFGQIINVASVAGLLPGGPSHTLYGAAKAFVIKFSESLAVEVGPRGVNVLAACPGFTHSEFHDVNETRTQLAALPKWMWMSADTVARQSLSAVARGETVYVNGLTNRAITSFFRSMPEGSASALMKRNAKQILKRIS